MAMTTSTDVNTNVMTITVSMTPAVSSTLTPTSLASENVRSETHLYYVIGTLAVLVILVGTLAILMPIFYAHKSQRRNQRNGEAFAWWWHYKLQYNT